MPDHFVKVLIRLHYGAKVKVKIGEVDSEIDSTIGVRRVGGAYGGKITQTAWTDCASALAAVVLQQPVAMHNERGDDMTMVCEGLFGLIL